MHYYQVLILEQIYLSKQSMFLQKYFYLLEGLLAEISQLDLHLGPLVAGLNPAEFDEAAQVLLAELVYLVEYLLPLSEIHLLHGRFLLHQTQR